MYIAEKALVFKVIFGKLLVAKSRWTVLNLQKFLTYLRVNNYPPFQDLTFFNSNEPEL